MYCICRYVLNLYFNYIQTYNFKFQARLYNEVDLIEKRNKCALEYRLLEEDHPSKNNTALATFL